MSSDSSSDEDINLEFLREATDTSFISDSMFKGAPQEKDQNKTENIAQEELKKLPSLRKSKDEDEQFNFFRVTPEFREFIARKLTKILESNLTTEESFVASKKNKDKKVLKKKEIHRRKKNKKTGVKLFKTSKVLLDVSKNEEEKYLAKSHPTLHKQSLKPKTYSIEITEETLRKIAVSPETVLSKKETQFWSNRYKSKNFLKYKKNKKGVLELVEPEFI